MTNMFETNIEKGKFGLDDAFIQFLQNGENEQIISMFEFSPKTKANKKNGDLYT